MKKRAFRGDSSARRKIIKIRRSMPDLDAYGLG
jgi:hypothetical protein